MALNRYLPFLCKGFEVELARFRICMLGTVLIWLCTQAARDTSACMAPVLKLKPFESPVHLKLQASANLRLLCLVEVGFKLLEGTGFRHRIYCR